MTSANTTPFFRSVEELAVADWVTLNEKDLPAYKSPAFFALLSRLGVTLESYRSFPVYRHAVEVGLIVNDEWTSVDVTLPDSLVEHLWGLLADIRGQPLETSDGQHFVVQAVQADRDDAAITIKIDGVRRHLRISREEIETGAEFWLGGASIAADNLATGQQILGKSSVNSPLVAAVLSYIAPSLGEFVRHRPEFQQFPWISTFQESTPERESPSVSTEVTTKLPLPDQSSTGGEEKPLTLTMTQTLEAFETYLDIRAQNGLPPPNSADVEHSGLLPRLLSGKAPLPEPPPVSWSRPWYDLIENGWAERCEVKFFDGLILINHGGPWTLISQASDIDFVVQYRGQGDRWRVWRSQTETRDSSWSMVRLT